MANHASAKKRSRQNKAKNYLSKKLLMKLKIIYNLRFKHSLFLWWKEKQGARKI